MLGTFASPNAKDSTFALTNARNTNMLVSLVLGDAHFLRVLPDTKPKSYVLPDASQWNIGGVGLTGVRVGVFQWNMGLNLLSIKKILNY